MPTVDFLRLVAAMAEVVPLPSKGGSIVALPRDRTQRGSALQVVALLEVPSIERLGKFTIEEKNDPVRAYTLSREAVIV